MKSPFSRFFGGGDKQEGLSEKNNEELRGNAEKIIQLPISQIIPNPYQPRTLFDEEKIEELARTIHTHGVIQPIVLRAGKEQDLYEIIAGERRFRAMKTLGWETVPALVRELGDKETASIALIENLQREELTSIEEAAAYQNLLELHEITQEALAQRLGKSQSSIANKLRLLKLPEEVKNGLLQREVSERHARALIPLKDEALQVKLYMEVIEQQLNVKQLEARVAKFLDDNPVKAKPRRKAVSRDVRIAMNTIKESLNMVTKSGVALSTEEEEHDDYYQITVKIPKKKK